MDVDEELDPLAQHEVEVAMRLAMRGLNEATQQVAEQAHESAQADHAYKVARARQYVTLKNANPKWTVGQLDAEVSLLVAEESLAAAVAEAKLRAAQERGRNLRAQLEALRSLAANVRTVVQP